MATRKDAQLQDQPSSAQAERLEELRRQAKRIDCAQDRSNIMRVLDELERIRASHDETQRTLAEGRRRTLRWAGVLAVLAFTWLTLMLIYHL